MAYSKIRLLWSWGHQSKWQRVKLDRPMCEKQRGCPGADLSVERASPKVISSLLQLFYTYFLKTTLIKIVSVLDIVGVAVFCLGSGSNDWQKIGQHTREKTWTHRKLHKTMTPRVATTILGKWAENDVIYKQKDAADSRFKWWKMCFVSWHLHCLVIFGKQHIRKCHLVHRFTRYV